MVCKTETKQIEDKEYTVIQWPAEKAILMKLKLIKILGPALSSLVSNKDNEIDISNTLSILFENSSPEELMSLIKECLTTGLAIEGKRVTENSFNEVFDTDDIILIYRLFVFVLEVNYSNFFKGQWGEGLLAKVKENL